MSVFDNIGNKHVALLLYMETEESGAEQVRKDKVSNCFKTQGYKSEQEDHGK